MPWVSNRRSVLDLFQSGSDAESRPQTSLLRPITPSSPQRPSSEGGYAASAPPPQSEESLQAKDDVAASKSKRMSLMTFRNYSESHLSTRAKDEDEIADAPPVPTVPSIVKTAPTMDSGLAQAISQEPAEERKSRPSLFKRTASRSKTPAKREERRSMDDRRTEKKPLSMRWRPKHSKSSGLEDLARLATLHAHENQPPPSYGDSSQSALALPVADPRFSDSSRSDGSSDHIYGSTTTTTHTVSTHTTFFKLPRRNKNRNSLFPLPVKIDPPDEEPPQLDPPTTPRASTSANSTASLQTPKDRRVPPTILARRHTDTSPRQHTDVAPPLPTTNLAKSSLSFAEPGHSLLRNDSQRSRGSSASSPLHPPMRLGNRGRASTASSFGRSSHELGTPPPFPLASGRNSTSTTGRSSLGGLLTLSRFRQSSDPHSPRHGSPGTNSKSNSFALSREALVVPEREEGDTPGKYLDRLEAAVARSMIAGILSKSADPFAQAVLRSYTRRFAFFGEPIDMSLRKFLLEADLPKETQQVDRVIQAFADRYHECNPGIFIASDQAYIIAFSLMMLHTDAFNKNNKRKMQKHDYIKNTSGQQVSDDVLGCFYDNICYTPFVHYEEEVDINGERVLPFSNKTKKGKLKNAMPDSAKKPTGPVDPYNLLVEQKLDALRPAIKDFIAMEDSYNYRGPQTELEPQYLQRAFTHTGVLQIISARSRPTAYEGNLTNVPDPNDTQAGIIDLKITKVGTLWRKATKKKKARSPWQEWGAVLTGSQLYLFKNAHWAKGLMHQFKEQQKPAHPRIPVVFKPPLQDFKPDALIKTDNAVALIDSTYTRHKNAFLFVRPGGQEEVLLAENENELHDWLALINYAAAFRTAGVRIRGMVGGTEEDIRSREVTVIDASESTKSMKTIQTAHGEMTIENRGLSPQLQRQVMAARRQIMLQKINEMGTEITTASKQLDALLRNARHLLVLAPIAPRTRDVVIHAAARADAMVKWTRRDIWRVKCHRDILAMDVQEDGISANEVQTLAEQTTEATPPETSRKVKAKGLGRFNSKTSATRSPPQSPKSPAFASRNSVSGRPSMAGRQSLAESLETYNDVFRTPPESATFAKENDWRLPPLQLDVEADHRHRGSVTSTLLTVSSAERAASISQTSSNSSMRHNEHLSLADHHSESGSRDPRTPEGSIASREAEMLARTTTPPDSVEPVTARVKGLDGALMNPTSDSKPKSGVRRSLHKTLREAHHSGSHKHKRGKDSDATIRSGTADGGGREDDQEDGTPGLTREKGRFILHGKQASVVQFGSDWPNERMKQRRERWRQTSNVDLNDHQLQQSASGTFYPSMSASPLIRDLSHPSMGSDATETSSISSAKSPGFREDAEAAEAYASASEYISSPSLGDGKFAFPAFSDSKRQTVIGPNDLRRHSSLQKTDDEDGEDEADNTVRRSVLGPSIRVVDTQSSSAPSSREGPTNNEGAGEDSSEEDDDEDEDEDDEDDSSVQSIDDDELRRLSAPIAAT